MLIAFCEMAYVSFFAEAIDFISIINNKGFPVEITLFSDLSLNKRFGTDQSSTKTGFRVYLPDQGSAIRFMTIFILSILLLFIIKGVLSYSHTYLISRVGQKLILNLRSELYDRIVHLPLSFFTEKRTGDIMSRATNDMSMLQNSVNSIADAIQALATVVIFLVRMITKSWQLTLLTAIVFPPAIVLINRFGRKIKTASNRIQSKLSDISSYLERTISGVKIIKSFTAESWEKERFDEENKAKYVAAMKRVKLSAYLIPLIEVMSALGMMLVFWVGFWQVISGKLTVGWFIGFITMVGMVYKPVRTLGSFNSAFQQAIASAERIFELMDAHPETDDSPDALELDKVVGDVEFKDVSFTYNGNEPALEHVNLTVKAGESVALVGPSGAGKTTLINLLTRFYNVKDGEITIDGHPISKIKLRSLRSHIGLVPQETILFSGTVKENIAYGRLGATDEDVINAAKEANAHDFIMKLPNGYNTYIGEHGAQLSGGQRQRIAIARSILKNPSILILDEATSSLDAESEALVQDALTRLMKGRTTFIIAHRLTTITNADKIVVIDKGRIVEVGTHQQLYERQGVYRRIFDSQIKLGNTDRS